MAEHITALPEQLIERAPMMTTVEYEKTFACRVSVKPPGQVFDAIKSLDLLCAVRLLLSFRELWIWIPGLVRVIRSCIVLGIANITR